MTLAPHSNVTIGMPLYNKESFLQQRIESIMNQSYSNFILLISDNGSTDNSQKICKEMTKTDERIVYYRHEKNKGPIWNFNFVLEKAKTKYFVWASPDDIWSQNFLEKNINFLEKNDSVVGSIGEFKLYNRIIDPITHKTKIKILENSKKFQYVHPVHGTVEEKIKFYLNFSMAASLFAVYRTDKLKQSNTFGNTEHNQMWMTDLAYLLNIIKKGDFEVISDTSICQHVTEKSTSVIQFMKGQKYNLSKILFINFPFTFWCLENLGLKIFLKNFNYFIKLNLKGEYSIIAELMRMCKRIMCGQEKYW